MFSEPPRGTVWIVCGFIGSGKTTFSRRVVEKRQAIHLSSDQWMLQLFDEHMPREVFDQKLNALESRFRHLAVELSQRGVDTVLDGGFWKLAARQAVRKWGEEVGVPLRFVHMDTPRSTARDRAIRRLSSGEADCYRVDGPMFDELWHLFEEPTGSEKFDHVLVP